MWLIEDEQSLKSQLPHKYGVDDIPLILQDMEFNGDGLQLFKQNQPHFVVIVFSLMDKKRLILTSLAVGYVYAYSMPHWQEPMISVR